MTIVVPVLMIGCQVSEQLKTGPVAAHATTEMTHSAKTHGRPAACATPLAVY